MEHEETDKTRTVTMPAQPENEHQIRLRAYEIYEARGRKSGNDLDDWLTAEAEITSILQRAA